MEQLTIRNTGKVPVLIILDHKIYCRAAQQCSCQVRKIQEFERDRVSGARKSKERTQRVPKTLIIPVGGQVEADASIRTLQGFKDALKSGQVKVITEVKQFEQSEPAKSPSKKKK